MVRSRMQDEPFNDEILELDCSCLVLDETVAEREEAPAARSNIRRHRVANSCTRALRFRSILPKSFWVTF